MKKFSLFKRTFLDLWPLAKESYLYTLAFAIFTHGIPFLNFIYMARAINLLAAGAYDQVYQVVMQYLVIFFIFQLINAWIEPLRKKAHTQTIRRILSTPNEKMMTVNFHYADNSVIQEKLHQVNRDQQQNNSSFNVIYQHNTRLIMHLVQLIYALILLVPLWRTGGTSLPGWDWINSVWSNIGLLALILGVVALQAYFSMRTMGKVAEQGKDIVEVNAMSFYAFQLFKDPEAGKDIRLYKTQGQLRGILDRFSQYLDDFFTSFYGGFIQAEVTSAIGSQVINWLIYLVIGMRVIVGALPIGTVIQLTGAINQMMAALGHMLSYLTIFTQPAPMERFYEIMDLPDEIQKGTLPIEKRLDHRYKLSVDQLSFTYPNSTQEIIKGVSEDFEIGKRYAIVGENGSGKTTFIKLLMRLYEPTHGEVRLNDIDGNKYSLQEFYQLFSVVFQDFRLLGMTMGENISVSPGYDEELLARVVEEVGLDEFVESLSRGADTYLGTEFDKSGVSVSGGQAQKIAMARALYKDAPIMILDEPTAALDPMAEFEIYQKFDQIVEDKTAFYISHRLSFCRFCDEILVFDEGRVVQRGHHRELVAQSGKYQELWHAQAQYYQ